MDLHPAVSKSFQRFCAIDSFDHDCAIVIHLTALAAVYARLSHLHLVSISSGDRDLESRRI